ncbi:MAG: diacylglycerol kinase family protein [Nitrospirota bacterium]|nr:diacylglycerol kinase family protein [Nitrospirota bacterium]MDE3244236.1 diacylglycerol kinase family protein [Nitrospirota bacterium]
MSPLKQVGRRFAWAWAGLKAAFQAEQSFRIQLAVAGAVSMAGVAVGLSQQEWLFIVMAIGMVLSLELLNTMIEKTLDLLHPAQHERVKFIKDISAAAVLLSSLAAAIVGLFVFGHHLL